MPPSSRSPQPAKAVLAFRDISLVRVAADLGVSKHWVGRVLNGRERPSADFRTRLAEYLELDADDLFVDDDGDVVLAFVKRTTKTSGVPLLVEDEGAAEKVAHALRGAG